MENLESLLKALRNRHKDCDILLDFKVGQVILITHNTKETFEAQEFTGPTYEMMNTINSIIEKW